MISILKEEYLKTLRELAALGPYGQRLLTDYEDACLALMRVRVECLTNALKGMDAPDVSAARLNVQKAARTVLESAPALADSYLALIVNAQEAAVDGLALDPLYELVRSEFV